MVFVWRECERSAFMFKVDIKTAVVEWSAAPKHVRPQDSALRKCSIRISVVIHTNRVSRVINSQPSGLTFFLGQVQLQPSMGMGTGSWTPEARGDWNGVILRATCKGAGS